MQRKHDIITLEVNLKHETQAAYLVDDGKDGVWVPKSQAEMIYGKDEFHGELQLPEWLAIEKGLV